jgi:monothiol glutaredoxin
MDIHDRIRQAIADNDVIIFMKGTPQFPQCGFSMRASQILSACGVEYAHVDVLAEPEVRQHLPAISHWPTFPQVFVRGELVGGCDILVELFQKGELESLLKTPTGS